MLLSRCLLLLLSLVLFFACGKEKKSQKANNADNAIQPLTENPAYWQYEGKPVLLLGASATLSIHDIKNVKNYVDSLSEYGMNYLPLALPQKSLQNTGNKSANATITEKQYLDKFKQLIKYAFKKNIIIALHTKRDINHVKNKHVDTPKVLWYKLLKAARNYNNILYDNQQFTITDTIKAKHKNIPVYYTENADANALNKSYTSNNKKNMLYYRASGLHNITGKKYWNTFNRLKTNLSHHHKAPLHTSDFHVLKNSTDTSQTPGQQIDKLCINILSGGAAYYLQLPSANKAFHNLTCNTIRAIRKAGTLTSFHKLRPAMNLLYQSRQNKAFMAAKAGRCYVIYFSDGGEVKLDLQQHRYYYMLHFINTKTGKWGDKIKIMGGKKTKIITPNADGWLAVIKKI